MKQKPRKKWEGDRFDPSHVLILGEAKKWKPGRGAVLQFHNSEQFLGQTFWAFLSPTSHGVRWACHSSLFFIIKAVKMYEWSRQCCVMHADMTGDMIACQLALNHFVVLFVQNNSQMPRFSSFKNVFLPNRGKKVTHRVFESRNNFRLLFLPRIFRLYCSRDTKLPAKVGGVHLLWYEFTD